MRYPVRFRIVQLILHSRFSRLPLDFNIPQPLRGECGRISRCSHSELERDGRSVRVRVILASVIIALQVAFPTLILSLSLSDSSSESGPSHHSVMVVRYACMACQCCPTGAYFTTYQAAAVHYARSTACHQSLCGIATVVLPNRPANAEAGGSGAAGGGLGRPNSPADQRRVRVRA